MARGGGAMAVGADQVRAYRLLRHGLTARRPAAAMLDIAGACGVQNSPPGSAALALHARLDAFTLDTLDRAVAHDTSLVQTWCMRGAPFFVPTGDLDVFTAGLLPMSEDGLRAFVFGVGRALDRLGMDLTEAVDRTETTLPQVLSGRELAINELGAELAERIATGLPPDQRAEWEAQGPYAANQPLGEAVVHFVLRISALRATVCLAPRRGNKAPFVLTAEWLGHTPPHRDRDIARAELLRRYLRSYGPSCVEHFASWAGISKDDAQCSWGLVREELRRVDLDGRAAWILAADVAALEAAGPARGVRLLPPGDPYTQQRDRATIVADTSAHRAIWKSVGAPGTVLVDGRIVGTWNARKQGTRLAVTVTELEPVDERARAGIEEEARAIAPLRTAKRADLAFA